MYGPAEMPLSPTLHLRQKNAPPPLGGERASRFDRDDGETLARKMTAHYWGMVTFIDDMVGRIMDVLTRRGLWESTLVVFTTDHGEMLGDFGRTGKENFTEAVIRVPYIVVPPASSTPSGADSARFVDGFVEHVDLVPTILDYAGLSRGRELPGISLRPILDGAGAATGEARTRDAILCEYVNPTREQRFKCVRTQRHKLVFGGPEGASAAGRAVQLFDLEGDPLERENVAGDPRYQDEIRRHLELLVHRVSWSESTLWNSGGAARAAGVVDHFGRPL
jgi:arylsulfatase